MDLTDLCDQDQQIIRRAAQARGLVAREFFRLLRERQAANVVAAILAREAQELRARQEGVERELARLRSGG